MRKFAILETPLMFGLVAAYIWLIRPVFPLFWIAIPLLMFLSHRIRRESARSLGFRVDNLRRVLGEYGPVLLLIGFVMLAAGFFLHTVRPVTFKDALYGVGAYLIWGLAQEYALNGYFLYRFDAVLSPGVASFLAAAMFSAVHAPNPFLMAVTFPLGWCATLVYRRTRNLYLLGIAHAVIGLLLFLVVPDSVSHHLRVGPGFFRVSGISGQGPRPYGTGLMT